MKAAKHLSLLGQAVAAWAVFWVIGLPDYYQQYSTLALAIGSILLSVAISLAAVYLLLRCRPEHRKQRALWLSFYYTVPLAILDSLYCGAHLGHGAGYVFTYWYLSVFYLTPWLTFLPTALLLGGPARASA